MQKLNSVKKVLICLLTFASLFFGCEYEKIPGPHVATSTAFLKSVYTGSPAVSLNSPVWQNSDYFVVPLSNLSINKTDTANGVLNGNGTFDGVNAFGDSAKLILRSVYNNNNIYILAEWKDISLDAIGRIWLWNGPKDVHKNDDSAKWTTQSNDDKLILKFKFPQSQNYSEDIWVWSVALSEPLGYAIDMVSKTDQTVISDAGTPMFARNGTNNRSGPLYEFNGQTQTITKGNGSGGLLDAAYFLYNKTAYTGNPSAGYISYKGTCFDCHGEGNVSGYAPQLNQSWLNTMSRTAIKNFILDPDQHSDGYSHVETLSDEALNNIFAWLSGQSGTPGYYLQTPSGSVADVLASSNVQTGKINPVNSNGYKVLLTRKLNTGNPDDLTFDVKDGTTYTIGIELCNKDSVNFIGAINQTLIFKNN